jgi:hypothetical protein
MARLPKQKPGVFDVSSLQPGTRVVIDEYMGMSSDRYTVKAVVVENPVHDPVLEDIPHQRQVLVRFDGGRKNLVVDATWIARLA